MLVHSQVFKTINLISIALIIKPLVKLILHSQSADKLARKHLFCFQSKRLIHRTTCHSNRLRVEAVTTATLSTDRNGPEGPLSQEPVTHEVVLQDQIAPACDFYARGDNN